MKWLEKISKISPNMARSIETLMYTFYTTGVVFIAGLISMKIGYNITPEMLFTLLGEMLAFGGGTSFLMGYARFIRNKTK